MPPSNHTRTYLLPIAAFVILLTNMAAFGQYRIESWTTDRGLPQNTVYSILQAPDGYLWLTTLDGIVRFDGARFTIFNKNNTKGIDSNRFTRVILDAGGDLWIGTEADFITRYRGGLFQTYSLKKGEKTNGIMNMFLNAGGELVVATGDGSYQWNGEAFAAYVPAAGETVSSAIVWSKNGTLWYANGPWLYRVKDGLTTEFRLPGVADHRRINKIFEDSRGRVWLGTQFEGLFYLENEKIVKFPLGEAYKDVTPNIEDTEGNIWASGNGAIVIAPNDGVTYVSTGQGLSENGLAGIFQDREGNIWAGTPHRGFNRLNRQSVSFISEAEGLDANSVYPIFQDREGGIWIGGESLTLYRNGKFEAVERPSKFPKTVTAIGQDAAGRPWFAHWGGVYCLENGQFVDYTKRLGINAAVYAIYPLKDGTLWFGTADGLISYKDGVVKRITTADGLAGNDIKIIHEAGDAALWVGTYSGLTRIKDGIFTSYTKKDGLGSDLIRSLYEDADGVLWIGSYDGGLARFKDEKFTRFTTNNGLFNDGVFQILEDARGSFWMSSNRGIYSVSRQQLNDFAEGKTSRIDSIAYNKADGLLDTECNGGQQPAGIKTRDGQFWFPTQSGVAVIRPESLKVNPVIPPVAIEGVKIDNEAFPAAGAIEIAPGKNNLEIGYTALSFIKPELVKFRYRLEGQDPSWIEAGNRRTAYYSYLPPGEYTFQVIAANADGVWNTDGASIKVAVKPPYYRTWWFWLLVFMIVAGSAYFLYRRRVERLEAQRRRQEEFSHELLASQEAERQRVAAELHDGLGQSLLLIKNRALLGTMSPDDREEAMEQFEEISRASSQAIEEVREIAYNLRPYHLDRLGLTQSIKAMLESIADSTSVDLAYDIMPLDGVFAKDEEVVVYRIVQESVNNILKHSEATEASVLIHESAGNGVTMTIEDNGRGFSPELQSKKKKGGFGLIGLDERVRILGGTLQIRSEPGDGTTIIVKELAKDRPMK